MLLGDLATLSPPVRCHSIGIHRSRYLSIGKKKADCEYNFKWDVGRVGGACFCLLHSKARVPAYLYTMHVLSSAERQRAHWIFGSRSSSLALQSGRDFSFLCYVMPATPV